MGTEATTCGARSSASASASDSGRTEFNTPGAKPSVLDLPGWICSVVVPNCVNCSTMYVFKPSPIDVSSTTAVTPMPMPSAVKELRSRCATTDCPTSLTKSCWRMTSPSHERVDRIECRRAARGQDAENEAARDRDGDGRRRRPRRGGEVEHRKQELHEPNAAHAERDPDAGAKQRQAR